MLTPPRPPCSAAAAASWPLRRRVLFLAATAASPARGRHAPPRRCRSRLAARTRTRCSAKWEDQSEYEYEYDDEDLEAEILEFMKGSSKPEAFPSRRELAEAGRGDLAEAIVRKGGWLSLGWDLDEEEREQEDHENYERIVINSSAWNVIDNDGEDSNNSVHHHHEASSVLCLYPYDNPKAEDQAETGIEGILSRLEKQRNDSFGFGVVENEDEIDGHSLSQFPPDTSVAGFRSSLSNDKFNHNKSLPNDVKPQMWRSWINQQASVSERDIQDTEIEPSEVTIKPPAEVSEDETLGKETANNEPREQNYFQSRRQEITHNQLRSRLQNLELELSSALCSVRSSDDTIASQMDHNIGSSNDLQKNNYDAWEFQENEIMKAQDKLRSTRAKLAVLEGKMALAIIEAQKIMDEKQKRIDNARRALRLLNSTCIVWPNPASEVLLAGSFDGWATLRKMEKSSTGLFSLWLQLYPGKYEIKFIVDGQWRVDPQRRTINNNGYLNNLLIIS